MLGEGLMGARPFQGVLPVVEGSVLHVLVLGVEVLVLVVPHCGRRNLYTKPRENPEFIREIIYHFISIKIVSTRIHSCKFPLRRDKSLTIPILQHLDSQEFQTSLNFGNVHSKLSTWYFPALGYPGPGEILGMAIPILTWMIPKIARPV